MRPVYGCPENFWESLSTPAATFAEIFNGLLFRSILWMCLQNLKFVALPIPEIIEGTKKIRAVPGYAHAPFSPTFAIKQTRQMPRDQPKIQARFFGVFPILFRLKHVFELCLCYSKPISLVCKMAIKTWERRYKLFEAYRLKISEWHQKIGWLFQPSF